MNVIRFYGHAGSLFTFRRKVMSVVRKYKTGICDVLMTRKGRTCFDAPLNGPAAAAVQKILHSASPISGLRWNECVAWERVG